MLEIDITYGLSRIQVEGNIKSRYGDIGFWDVKHLLKHQEHSIGHSKSYETVEMNGIVSRM